MYLGRYTLGQEVLLSLHATDGAPSAAVATRAPSVKVYDASGAQVLSTLMAGLDTVRSTGLFCYRLPLGSGFAVGRYMVAMGYATGGVAYLKAAHFDVVAGGDAAGAVISMYQLDRPHAKIVATKTDAGKRLFRRSPYL